MIFRTQKEDPFGNFAGCSRINCTFTTNSNAIVITLVHCEYCVVSFGEKNWRGKQAWSLVSQLSTRPKSKSLDEKGEPSDRCFYTLRSK